MPKILKIKTFGIVITVPERIRTSDLPLRRRSLYPAELQAQRYRFIIAKMGHLVNRAI